MLDKIKKIIRNTEILRYLIGGGLTTLINVMIYTILVLLTVKIRWANLIAMTVAKILSYFINKYYVYKSKSDNLKSMSKEAIKYVIARGFTGIIDYFATVILIEIYAFPKFLTKYFITFLVIVLNFLLGKYFVFEKKSDCVDICRSDK